VAAHVEAQDAVAVGQRLRLGVEQARVGRKRVREGDPGWSPSITLSAISSVDLLASFGSIQSWPA
jgi:hypothetical protein